MEGHTDAVSSVSFSLDGTRIVSGSHDHTIRLWDATSGQPVGEPLRGHTDPVSSVLLSPDGTRIVSASTDRTVRLWDVATRQPLGEPLRGHIESVSSVSFSPDGARIVSASKDGTVRLWDATITQNDQIIRFSSNSIHALQNPAELFESSRHHDRGSTSFSLGVDGWMLGPNRQLLFWVPLGLRQPFYTPRTVLAIPRGNAEIDLSRMAHGEHWRNCRDANTETEPTTDEIIRICPRFRILVIGNTGVGKSSLINHVFGVENGTISHNMPGEATIDHEFISQQNSRLVLHDSKGFEPGGKDNFAVVQDFIDRRGKMANLKDQLHAIWICLEIPTTGGRLLETATEAFFTLKRDGKLGKIPVVAVLTKYDMLITKVNLSLDDLSLEGLSQDDVNKLIKMKADAMLQDVCVGPLQTFGGPDIPYAVVSTKSRYKETLANLIQMTGKRVREHVSTEASAMFFIAQRVDPHLNIQE